jgi:hypothetical protein
MFDNIRLYSQTCNPSVTMVSDMDGDCDADINDLDVFANSWLQRAELRTFDTITIPNKAPILWYKFNESGNTLNVVDYGTGDTNNYAGTVARFSSINWDATHGRNGGPCLFIAPNPPFPTNTQSYISAPTAAFGFMGDEFHSGTDGGEITFSTWANASMVGDFLAQWPGIFGIWDAANSLETLEMPCPSRIGPGGSGDTQGQVRFIKRGSAQYTPAIPYAITETPRPYLDFGGRWNHWVWVKSNSNVNGPYSRMAIYCNGQVVSETDANGEPGDPNAGVNGPLFPVPASNFYIGCRNPGWAMWSGRLADFKVYDYALSDAEIAYEATDGTGRRVLPLITRANIWLDGGTADDANQIVNFEDLAVIGNQWHQIQLWP